LFGQYTRPKSQFGGGFQPGLVSGFGTAICKSQNKVATSQFISLYGKDPCRQPETSEGASQYDGVMPFPYDYAGRLNRRGGNGESVSNIIYAIKKN
jgi:hypothetical protein